MFYLNLFKSLNLKTQEPPSLYNGLLFKINMNYRTIRLFYPNKNNNFINTTTSTIFITNKKIDIYKTLNLFEKKYFQGLKLKTKKINKKIKLSEIINLHDDTGIRDTPQIKNMINQIKNGKEITSQNKLPNIKLIKTKNNNWVLFDGHHSILAYMYVGRKYLNEIPHLIVYNQNQKHVTNKEIHIFFGIHAKKLDKNNWMKYVINWQAPKEKQLSKRTQKNMQELFKSIFPKILQL
ncbi:hypothetical protein CMI38_05005 [Candidatus Pacearchaeota archaeon]|jgi:hypothetical protein|nr:hypothetical protein [Candidatus Pacearchaeota archaeon]|tara:strand:- start:59 stop:766 length:708 start_codon:yes stop_codon:yes gene_type:complete